ncbi:MAG: PQQ-binding-like beta-propeller repeat protein [Anaerolineales bacterium]|nr:PQQ-binding-like beta-propeller repeat protein [Anaerolineales bacterium]
MSTENGSAAPTESLRMTRQQGWLLLLVLIALSAVLFALDANGAPAVEREVVAATGFVPRAKLSQVAMMYPPALSADTAVFVGSLNPDDDPQLTAIDLNSGELRWQVTGADQLRPDLWPDEVEWIWPFAWRWGPVILVGDQLIAADAFGLTTTVNAFDIHTGAPGWQHSIGMINGSEVGYLVPGIDDTVVARVAVEGYSEFQIIDPATGLRQFRRQEDAGAIFWVDDEPRRVFEAFANQIRVTGEQAWQQTVPGCGALPLMTDTLIIVQTFPCVPNDNRGVPGLAALSRTDGTV